MEKAFSSYLESKHGKLKSLVYMLNQEFEYASILGSDVIGKQVSVTDKRVTVADSGWNERGFVVRIFNNGVYSEYSFDEINDVNEVFEKIKKELDVKEALKNSIYAKAFDNKLIEEEGMNADFSRMEEFKEIDANEVINNYKKVIKDSMDKYEYIIAGSCRLEYVIISKIFISNKKDLTQVYSWVNETYNCVVNRDGNTKFNYGGFSGATLEEVDKKFYAGIEEINKTAIELLDSVKVEPGEYDCITAPEITGLIAHEAFGHGVEMDMFVKNRALGAKYINKRVGSDLVEMHEGTLPYVDVSSYFFDDEGTLAHDTIEIKDGILQTGVADAIAASHLNIKPTGNGKRESFQRKAYSRMTATYFSPKKDKLEDMIKSIKHGYLIDKEMSGMEDPKNWGIQCIALIGREIVDGKFSGKIISPVIMTGYVPDLLGSISMVSDDFELYGSGACGKGYKEWVKTSVGGPYLKARVKLG